MDTMLWAVVGLSIVEWVMVYKGWSIRKYTKPAPMVLLILWFSFHTLWQGWTLWFGLALVFSLAGDIFLLLPARFFLSGLFAFLTAHIFYIVGFNQSFPWFNGFIILLLFMIAFIGYWNFFPLLKALNTQDRNLRMRFPVTIYGVVISLMLFSALLNIFRPAWTILPIVLTIIGAVCFYASDSILARQKFIKSTPLGRTLVMVTYLLAQILITVGVVIHFT